MTAPRILVIRLSAIGDVVMASGLIPALRETSPDAFIAWLVEPAAAPLLRHNPRLDEVIVLPRGEWLALWRIATSLCCARCGRFDAACARAVSMSRWMHRAC